MGLADTARLVVELNLKGDLDKGVIKTSKSLTGLSKTTGTATKGVTGLSKMTGAATSNYNKMGKGIASASKSLTSLDKAATGTDRSVQRTDKGVSRLGKSLSGLKASFATGLGLGVGLMALNLLATGIHALIGFVSEAQQASSDLAEQQDKLGLVFTESAERIRDWSETAANGMGLSKRAALEAAGTFGNFIKAMGIAEDQSADMSMGMVQLAADLASFNNTAGGAEEVLEAISAGLRGETEPMMRFGVVLLETNVSAKALEMGMQKVAGKFTDAQKVQARYALIMEKTATAQGNFALTAASSANQARTLASVTEDTQAKMGRFADNVTKVAQGLAIDLVNALDDAAEHFHVLERLAFPHIALQEDITKALVAEAEARGLSTKGIAEFVKMQYAEAEAVKRTAEQEARLIEVNRILSKDYDYWKKIRPDVIEALEAERDALMGVASASDDNMAAVSLNAEGQAKFNEILAEYLGLSDEQRAALVASSASAEENAAAIAAAAAAAVALAAKQKLAAKAALEYRQAARATTQGILDMADSVDIARGSFSGFWKQVKSDQGRLRYLIRNPGLLRRETNRLESTLADFERQRIAIEQGGVTRRERLQYQAVTNLIAMLTGRIDELGTVGITMGEATAQGFKAGFGGLGSLGLMGWLNGARDGTSARRTTAPRDREVRRRQRSDRTDIHVTMSAYQSNREIQRTVNTRRMSFNAL